MASGEAGLRELFRQFSFPGGIPSHAAPETPGSIHEGGELGYALAVYVHRIAGAVATMAASTRWCSRPASASVAADGSLVRIVVARAVRQLLAAPSTRLRETRSLFRP